jgi:general secretion pathway protein L
MPLFTEHVGLDIGRSAIKAVRIRRVFGGRDTVTCFESPLPDPGDRAMAQPVPGDLLRAFVERHRLVHATVVTALPCRSLVIRTLALPFQDPRTLSQVVPFEMEPLLPLPLEDVTLDCFALPPTDGTSDRGKPGGPTVLVAAAPKSALAAHLGLLSEAGLSPASINVDALALHAVARYLANGSSGLPPDCAIIDVGASKTTVCLLHRGYPIVLRTIGLGGDHVTGELAKHRGCSFQEAEAAKRTMSAAQLDPWLSPLVHDLRLALHAYEAETGVRLRSYWLCGGTAKLNGLTPYIERRLDLHPVGNGQGFGHLCPPTFSIAFGLAVGPPHAGSAWTPIKRLGRSQATVALDFKRASELVPRAPHEIRRDLWHAGLGAALVAVLALADLFAQVAVRETYVRELSAALQEQYRLPFKVAAPPGEEVDLARRKLEDAKKTLAFLQGNRSVVLPVLAELTRHAPRDIGLKVDSLTIEDQTVTIEAETSSFEAVEKFKQQLAGSTLFQGAAVGDAHVGVSPGQILFRATLMVRLP